MSDVLIAVTNTDDDIRLSIPGIPTVLLDLETAEDLHQHLGLCLAHAQDLARFDLAQPTETSP